jgi:hypothetical protein
MLLVTVVFRSRRRVLTPATKPPPEVAAELPWTLALSMYICEVVSPLTPPAGRHTHVSQLGFPPRRHVIGGADRGE